MQNQVGKTSTSDGMNNPSESPFYSDRAHRDDQSVMELKAHPSLLYSRNTILKSMEQDQSAQENVHSMAASTDKSYSSGKSSVSIESKSSKNYQTPFRAFNLQTNPFLTTSGVSAPVSIPSESILNQSNAPSARAGRTPVTSYSTEGFMPKTGDHYDFSHQTPGVMSRDQNLPVFRSTGKSHARPRGCAAMGIVRSAAGRDGSGTKPGQQSPSKPKRVRDATGRIVTYPQYVDAFRNLESWARSAGHQVVVRERTFDDSKRLVGVTMACEFSVPDNTLEAPPRAQQLCPFAQRLELQQNGWWIIHTIDANHNHPMSKDHVQCSLIYTAKLPAGSSHAGRGTPPRSKPVRIQKRAREVINMVSSSIIRDHQLKILLNGFSLAELQTAFEVLTGHTVRGTPLDNKPNYILSLIRERQRRRRKDGALEGDQAVLVKQGETASEQQAGSSVAKLTERKPWVGCKRARSRSSVEPKEIAVAQRARNVADAFNRLSEMKAKRKGDLNLVPTQAEIHRLQSLANQQVHELASSLEEQSSTEKAL